MTVHCASVNEESSPEPIKNYKICWSSTSTPIWNHRAQNESKLIVKTLITNSKKIRIKTTILYMPLKGVHEKSQKFIRIKLWFSNGMRGVLESFVHSHSHPYKWVGIWMKDFFNSVISILPVTPSDKCQNLGWKKQIRTLIRTWISPVPTLPFTNLQFGFQKMKKQIFHHVTNIMFKIQLILRKENHSSKLTCVL